ncbi:MAG: 50S ribosomal protein L23 [Myxococcota bacterium]
MNQALHDIIRAPVVTEKAAQLQSELNQMCLYVHPKANKLSIAQAIKEGFGVEVLHVRTCIQRGKPVRKRVGVGKRCNAKKAFVTFKNGQDAKALGIDLAQIAQRAAQAQTQQGDKQETQE